MISAYNLSLTGRSHMNNDMPCQDFSIIEQISPSWCIAAAADGVGSCEHSEIASEIAAREAVSLAAKLFPGENARTAEDFTSVIRAAFHGAANAVKTYVDQHDPGNEENYQTTLALALMSPGDLYFGNAGDGGVIALSEEDGRYHVLTHKGNDENGCVYSLPAWRFFETGKAPFKAVAALCFTDGILDSAAPRILSKENFNVNVPFVNMFCTYGLGLEGGEKEEAALTVQKLTDYLRSDECSFMTDDLSAAVMVNTESLLTKKDIPWQEPVIDCYALKFQEFCYTDENSRNKMFLDYIKDMNPGWNEDEINTFALKYFEGGESLKSGSAKKPKPPKGKGKLKASGGNFVRCFKFLRCLSKH